jgi:hypothetical protein
LRSYQIFSEKFIHEKSFAIKEISNELILPVDIVYICYPNPYKKSIRNRLKNIVKAPDPNGVALNCGSQDRRPQTSIGSDPNSTYSCWLSHVKIVWLSTKQKKYVCSGEYP